MNKQLSFSPLAILSATFLTAVTALPVYAAPAKNTASSSSESSIDKLMKEMQEQAARLAEQEKKLDEQEKALLEQRKVLTQEKLRFESLQTRVIAATGRSVPVKAAAAPQATAYKQAGKAPEEVGTDRKQNPEKPPEIAAVIEEGGVLLQKGKLVVTPALEYTHSSATRVAIEGFSIIPSVNIGLFDISRVNRDILTPSIGLRYGVTNRFEIDAKIPYVYRKDDTNTRPIGVANAPETLTTVDGMDIGDIEMGAHYQINKGENNWPFFIGNLRFKTATGTSPFEVPVVAGVQQELPTGSGFYALQPSITAIYPTDPVVYYSNLGYLHNFGRSFPTYGKIEPGDSISGSFGMSLSLNDKASVSMGYSHNTVLKTMQNGQTISNSPVLQVGSLDIGYSYALNPTTNLNFTVSTGVTEDAPDVRLVFRVPMTFDLN